MNRVRPYIQLARLPNVFTAFADICLAALAIGVALERWPTFVLLLLASGCLYCGGMVWNDFFDIEQDRRERPFRPLPSGRVKRSKAGWLGAGLLSLGWLFALGAGSGPEGEWHWTPVIVASLLVAMILLYDGWLKRTWAGPLAMGSCRFLNVLLGLCVAGPLTWTWEPHLAAVVGLYIVGVTWLARKEAGASSPLSLTGAAVTMLASLLLGLMLPARLPPGAGSPLFPYLLVVLGFLVGLPISYAILRPTPARVQAAVRRALMGLVVLDAVLATGLVGAMGLLILLLLLPVIYLNRRAWLYVT
ncbi:MAG TPA: UbiA family prenyltransferase [Gemmataceae bacterium]|jgi:4-hydroxybenzoate polyprenyltransferase